MRAGDRDAAVQRLAEVVADPRAKPEIDRITAGFTGEEAFVPANVRLEAMFEGSPEQRDALLAAAYERVATAFADAETDARTRGRRPGPCWSSFFTGSQCQPCIPADLALDAVAERVPRRRPHRAGLSRARGGGRTRWRTPRPWPGWSRSARTGRRRSSSTASKPRRPPGGPPAAALFRYRQFVGEVGDRSAEPAGAGVTVEASGNGDVLTFAATATRDGGFTQNHRLHVAVAERVVPYAARNGIRVHQMLVRSLPTGADGEPAADGELRFEGGAVRHPPCGTSWRRTSRPTRRRTTSRGRATPLDLDDLTVVAWVTDGPAGPVLQAARRDVDGLTPPAPREGAR